MVAGSRDALLLELLKSAKEHKAKHPTIITPERRQHMSEAKKGKHPYVMTDEIRQHMSIAHKARQADPALRKRTSDAMKAYWATVKRSGTGA
jgi:hypothetical protein